jgi:tetratricopeptide (TPR) repeat protein
MKESIIKALFLATAIFSCTFSVQALDVPAAGGPKAVRNAFDDLTKNINESDTASRFYKLGIAHAKLGDTAKALVFFRAVAQRDQALAPLAWKAMGLLSAKKNPDSAAVFFKRAIGTPVPNRFRNKLFEKLQPLIANDTLAISRAPFYQAYASWWKARRPAAPEPLCNRFDTLLKEKKWQLVDSLVNCAFAGLNDSIRRVIVKMVDRELQPSDSAMSTAGLYLLGRVAMDCGLFEIAERMLAAAQKKPDFASCVTDQSRLRFRGRLSFYEKNYGEAVATLTGYIDRFGYEPDLVLLIARAYRDLDRLEESAAWYDRFIARAAGYPSLADILWRRAWMEEERDRPLSAKEMYKRVYVDFPASRFAEESWVRHALCHYRMEQYDSAAAVLSRFEKKFPTSSLLSTAQYWKAKCFLKLDKNADARELLAVVSKREPYDYYAHRSRELFTLMGDSAMGRLSLDSVYDVAGSTAWLDSVSPPGKKAVSPEDSLNLRRGLVAAITGDVEDAMLFLEPVEIANASNLSLEFKIGAFYRSIGDPAGASSAGRRLSWRIPLEARAAIPLPVYDLIYPRYFLSTVKKEATDQTVDPWFVYAVMRQESSFNPDIISPAGAIGLMQIMPATGKTIARKLGVPFTADSLVKPEVNIKFGAWYLNKLLDQFNENKVLALASYNAGPTNAMGWYLRNKEKDIDLFVEDIDFSETRKYVKMVLGNYWFYLKLARVLPEPGE